MGYKLKKKPDGKYVIAKGKQAVSKMRHLPVDKALAAMKDMYAAK